MDGFLFSMSILSGLLSFSLYNIGFALEKKAINKLPEEIRSNTVQLLKNILKSKLWLLGLLLTLLSMVFYFIALLWAPLSAIAPLAGFGILVLVVYAHIDLKESVKKLEIVGIVLIIVGITVSSYLISLGDSNYSWDQWKVFSHSWNGLIMIGGSLLIAVSFTFIPYLFKRKIQPFDIAIFTGLIAGIQAILVKGVAVWAAEKNWDFDLFIAIVYFLGVLLTALISTGSLQFAFREGKISNVMAIYNGMMTIFPIFFGGIILLEWNSLILVQQIFLGISILVTFGGILILSLKHSHSLLETNR